MYMKKNCIYIVAYVSKLETYFSLLSISLESSGVLSALLMVYYKTRSCYSGVMQPLAYKIMGCSVLIKHLIAIV